MVFDSKIKRERKLFKSETEQPALQEHKYPWYGKKKFLRVKITQSGKVTLKVSLFSLLLVGSMVTSLEGLGSDNVFSLHEDNHYRISKSLVKSAEGSTVPLTRVKCLVSMTTPHDIRLHGSSITPAFVEFDTSLEGFG